MFAKFDVNNDGSLSKNELYQGMKNVLGEIETQKNFGDDFFEKIDTNGDGVVDRAEFIAGAGNRMKLLTKSNIESMFRMFDKDGDGFLTIKELKEVFTSLPESFEGEQKDSVSQMWEAIFKKADIDGNGELDKEEFT